MTLHYLWTLIFFYADDLKIVRVINNEQDCYTLQRDIDYLSEWCVENKLSLNINKCETMTLSRKKNKIVYNYKIGDFILEGCCQKKDLGIIIDSELSFIPHYEYINSHCLKMLGFIIRNSKQFTSIDCLRFYIFHLLEVDWSTVVWPGVRIIIFTLRCLNVYKENFANTYILLSINDITSRIIAIVLC